MQQFTGIEYVKIDIANQFGLDRLKWNDRIHWVNNNRPDLIEIAENSEKPHLYAKAIRALEAAEQGIAYRFNMGLDATASGLQMMAAMSGCQQTARCVNLIDTGNREDVYQEVATTMSQYMKTEVTRKLVKKPIMTFFYGSQAQPKSVFGEGEALIAFYSALGNLMPGAMELMKLFQSYWDPTAYRYQWAMPDGHVVDWPVMESKDQEVEIDEAAHTRFIYRAKYPQPQTQGRSLAANITHSVDAYACREMIRRCHIKGIHMAPIHDCFYAHPNDMNIVRQSYIEVLADISEQNLVSNILSQISGRRNIGYQPDRRLTPLILEANYALS
jgi:DNA-directed RNA polymerase